MSRLEVLAAKISGLGGWRRAAVLVAAGAATALSMPPIGAWPVLFITFPLLAWVMDGAVRGSFKICFALGWLFGLGYFIVSLYWIGIAFLVDADTYLWMMPFMVGGLAAGMAIYFGLAMLIMRLLWCDGVARLALMAAAFGIVEWLRGHLLTGFPWTALGLAAGEMGGVAQIASLIGMTGLTFMVVLWGSLPAAITSRRIDRGIALGLAASLPLAFLWGSNHAASPVATAEPQVRVRIVQPNVPQSDKWRAENGAAIFHQLLALSRNGSNPSFNPTHIIWPESAVPFLIDESPEALALVDDLLVPGSVLVTGSLRRSQGADGQHVFNSILAFDDSARIAARYDKWRLVPGGEFLPFEWLLEPLGFRKVVTVPGSFQAGEGAVSLALPGAPKASFLICYEAIFPERITGAERPGWIINVTNDGWFGNSSGPYQHLAQVRMRAIEQGLPIVRAANTGISAIIDPHGRVIESLPLGVQGTIDAELPATLAATPYGRIGDVMLLILVVGGILPASLYNFGSAKRRRQLADVQPKEYRF